MFEQDKEIVVAIITSTLLFLFLVIVIVAAIVKYQGRVKKYLHEMSDLKIKYQEETIKAQLEKEEQTLTRISQEIHDNIGQILSLVKLNLNTLCIEGCSDSIINKVTLSKELVGKAIVDLRQLSQSLNSMHLSKGYLSELLKSELDIINRTGVYVAQIDVSGEEKAFSPQKQLIIFRIAQEALNNIIKHAKASHINIIMEYSSELLNLVIKDNGIGFNNTFYEQTNLKNSGTGIGNLYNRAKLIGGKLEINSLKRKGTTVRLLAPID